MPRREGIGTRGLCQGADTSCGCQSGCLRRQSLDRAEVRQPLPERSRAENPDGRRRRPACERAGPHDPASNRAPRTRDAVITLPPHLEECSPYACSSQAVATPHFRYDSDDARTSCAAHERWGGGARVKSKAIFIKGSAPKMLPVYRYSENTYNICRRKEEPNCASLM